MRKFLFVLFYFAATFSFSQGIEVSFDKKSKKFGFTRNDTMVIAPRFKRALDFTGKFAWAKTGRKWGLINLKGEWAIAPAYRQVQETEENFCLVRKGRKYGLVNLYTGKEVVPTVYKNNFFFEDFSGFGSAAVVVQKRKAGLIDKQGKMLVACVYDATKIPFAEAAPRFYQVRQKKKMGLINWKGQLIIRCQFDEVIPSDGDSTTIDVKLKGKHGLYSTSGVKIVDCEFDNFISFDADGFATVVQNKKYGLINRQGKKVLACTYPNDDAMLADRQKLKK